MRSDRKCYPLCLRLILPLLVLRIDGLCLAAASNKKSKEEYSVKDLVLPAAFPADLRLKMLKDWQMFESLVLFSTASRLVRTKAGQVLPQLASSWSVSSDQKTVTFQLNPNARFADGTPITSDIVAKNIKRHLLLGGQFHPAAKENLLGLEQLNSPNTNIEGIQTPQPRTLVLRFKRSAPSLFVYLGFLSFSILKEQDFNMAEDKVPWDHVPSGPYRVESFAKDQVVLSRIPNDWEFAGVPLPERIIIVPEIAEKSNLHRVKEGEVDYWHGYSSELEKLGLTSDSFSLVPAGGIHFYMRANFNGPLLGSFANLPAVVSRLLNRDAMAASVFAKLGVRLTPEPHITGGIAEMVAVRQQAKAQKHDSLSKALVAEKQAFAATMKAVTIAAAESKPTEVALAHALAEQLNSQGLRARVVAMNQATMLATERSKVFDFELTSEAFDTDKPSIILPFLINSDARFLGLQPDHPIYAFTTRPNLATTFEEHLAILKDFNQMSEANGIIVPLFYDELTMVFSRKFDTSEVAAYEYIWHPQDFRTKGGE